MDDAQRIAAIAARRAAITPGEWIPGIPDYEVWLKGSTKKLVETFGDCHEADAEFIAAAPDDMRFLLAIIERSVDERVKDQVQHTQEAYDRQTDFARAIADIQLKRDEDAAQFQQRIDTLTAALERIGELGDVDCDEAPELARRALRYAPSPPRQP